MSLVKNAKDLLMFCLFLSVTVINKKKKKIAIKISYPIKFNIRIFSLIILHPIDSEW